MRKKADYVFTFLLLILGTAHAALTPMFYKNFDISSLWFAGTGLAFIFLSFINLFRINTSEKHIKILCLLADVLAFVFCILIIIKLTVPQAFISLFDLLVLSVLSIIDLRLTKKQN